MLIRITVVVDEDDIWADPDHDMGISNDAYDRLTVDTPDWGSSALSWLGEVQDVERVRE